MIGMNVVYPGEMVIVRGIVDAVSVMADGLAIARVNDRWVRFSRVHQPQP